MPNQYINKNIVYPSLVLDPDAIIYFSYWTIQPALSYKIKVSNLIKLLKADGNWTLLDRLWIFASDNQQGATISLVNPSSTPCTEVNAPSWAQSKGYTSNGTTSYLNTNFTPSTQASNYTRDNACQFIYSRTESQESSLHGGAGLANLNGTHVNIRTVADVILCRINGTTVSGSVSNSSSLGLITVERTSSTNINFKLNGVLLGSPAADTSTGLTAVAMYALCNNANGTAGSFSTRETSMYGFGSASINNLKLFTALNSYMSSIGTNVV